MQFETQQFESKRESETRELAIAKQFERFVPEAFLDDPIAYFEREGVNIRSGEVKRDQAGRIREDPTAVKDLPAWTDPEGNRLHIVGKRVNLDKGEVEATRDPFWEYSVLEIVNELGLPGAKPVAKARRQNIHLIVTERIPGFRWTREDASKLRKLGLSNSEIDALEQQGLEMMQTLRKRFEEAGIHRDWKLKDMVFDVDVGRRAIRCVTPTDWERTRIDLERSSRAQAARLAGRT